MGAHQNVIEINGKKYDAITGELLQHKTVATVVNSTSTRPSTQGVSMDGFSRKKTTAHQPGRILRPSPDRSHTLMRSAVKKPDHKLGNHKTADKTKTAPAHILGHSVRRDKTAQTVQKSSLIHRYTNQIVSNKLVKKIGQLEVKPAPAHHETTTQSVSIPAGKSKVSSLIDSALSNAVGHLEQKIELPKKRRLHHKMGVSRKTMHISSAVLAFVILGGFYAYLNVPNFAMRVAATRAGFSATMPSYKPAGFSFKGPINYSNGQVVVGFKSNSDNRQYTVKEQSSNWSSETLLTSYVMAQSKQYQTMQDKGRTLYIYDGSSATWVDNGIWYQIEGDSRLTSDQISRIAASL